MIATLLYFVFVLTLKVIPHIPVFSIGTTAEVAPSQWRRVHLMPDQ